MEGAVLIPDKPFRMVPLQLRSPAGVVDGDIDEEPGAAGMDAIRQFAELLERGGPPIELREGRVHIVEIQRSKRTAIPPHAGMSGGHREGRKQQDNTEAHVADDVIQPRGHGPEGAGGGDYGVACVIQRFQRCLRHVSGIVPEKPWKGGIDGVFRHRPRGFHFDPDIAFCARPHRRGEFIRQQIGLGFKGSHVGQGQGERPAAGAIRRHGEILPIEARRGTALLHRRDQFRTVPGHLPEIGAEKGPARRGGAGMQGKCHLIAGMADQQRTWNGGLSQGNGHAPKPSQNPCLGNRTSQGPAGGGRRGAAGVGAGPGKSLEKWWFRANPLGIQAFLR